MEVNSDSTQTKPNMSKLCSQCHGIFNRTSDEDTFKYGMGPTYTHHKCINDFRTAMENGCHLCYLLWSRLPDAIAAEEVGRPDNYSTVLDRFRWKLQFKSTAKHLHRRLPIIQQSTFRITWYSSLMLKHMESFSILFFFHFDGKWLPVFDRHLEIMKLKDGTFG